MSDFNFHSGWFPKFWDRKYPFLWLYLKTTQSLTVMMVSQVLVTKTSQFAIVIVLLEDFNIAVRILVMVHAWANVPNGNLALNVIQVHPVKLRPH